VTRTRVALLASAATVVLAAMSTVALAAVSGAFGGARLVAVSNRTGCAPSSLPGAVLDVGLIDMGASMMRGGAMMGGQGDWRTWYPGMMRVVVSRTSVPHGTVSLRVTNLGVMRHELLVLPLAAGQQPGTRPVGSDGKVDETGSLGEASRSCAARAGEGIDPATAGWVTLTLPAGRYELACNLAGHYAAGMYTELDLT
jgi:Sulfocyanin (SoxE) domain